MLSAVGVSAEGPAARLALVGRFVEPVLVAARVCLFAGLLVMAGPAVVMPELAAQALMVWALVWRASVRCWRP